MYSSIVTAAGAGLMQTAASMLQTPAELDFEGANDEFGRRLCDTMSAYGQQHVAGFEHRAAFMQQVSHSVARCIVHQLMRSCRLHRARVKHKANTSWQLEGGVMTVTFRQFPAASFVLSSTCCDLSMHTTSGLQRTIHPA